MRPLPCLIAAGVLPFAPAVTTGAPSLCRQLAAEVSRSAAVTADGLSNPGVVTVGAEERDRWGAEQEAVYALLRQALADKGGPSETEPNPPLELEHLPGTQVYMATASAGTANCQYSAFAAVGSNGSAHLLPNPAGDTGPCWNMHGYLGTVLGHPAYIETGTVDAASADTLTRVSPWSADGWQHPCQLTVELKYRFELAERFCGDETVCSAAATLAVDAARNYVAYRLSPAPPMRPIDPNGQVPDFRYPGREAVSPQGAAAVDAAWHLLARTAQAQFPDTPVDYGFYSGDFPTFGHQAPNGAWEYSFSHVGFALLPLTLQGHRYLGAIGHNGVGWREDPNILFAVYEAPGAGGSDLVPLAGFVVHRVPSGLKGTIVADGVSAAVPARPAKQ